MEEHCQVHVTNVTVTTDQVCAGDDSLEGGDHPALAVERLALLLLDCLDRRPCHRWPTIIFTESALRPIQSVSRDVGLCVCLSVTP